MVYLLSARTKTPVNADNYKLQPFERCNARGDIIGKVAENNLSEAACVG